MMRGIWLLVSTSVRVAPGQSLLCLCESVGVVVSLLQPLYLAWFVTGVVQHDKTSVITAATAFVLQIGFSRALGIVGMNARAGQLERVGYTFDTQIAEITARIPGIAHFDDPSYLDQLQILREEEGALGLSVNMLLNALNTAILVSGTIALAITADWRMLLVAAAGGFGLLWTPLLVRWQARAERAGAEHGRLAAHLLDLGTRPAAAGEIRVFELAGPLRQRLAAATAAWRAPKTKLAIREATITVASQIVFYGTAAAVLAWLTADVLAHRLGIGDLTLGLLLTTRLQGTSAEVQSVIRNVATLSRTAGRFLWLLDTEREMHGHEGDQAPPTKVRSGIRLDRVSYHYPHASVPAVDAVSLDIPAGTVLAVVGENGSGKTTLVNVITGLIPATEGAVLVDGRDTREFRVSDWRTGLAGAFQDHMRFEFTVGDAIGVGDLPARTDTDRIRKAAQDGSAESVVATLPQELETQLGSSWPNGVDLSGGQWQRIAIARGMMRSDPIVRILDEPTAALDAATEHQLFDRYAAAARAGRQSGTITILVTHRFSTVAAADLVVVLDRGRLIEHGTHAELLARRGRYAELYELQAAGYR